MEKELGARIQELVGGIEVAASGAVKAIGLMRLI
jgi:hypothetical protein